MPTDELSTVVLIFAVLITTELTIKSCDHFSIFYMIDHSNKVLRYSLLLLKQLIF